MIAKFKEETNIITFIPENFMKLIEYIRFLEEREEMRSNISKPKLQMFEQFQIC